MAEGEVGLGVGLSPSMWGDRFPISHGASWPSSAECTLCLEVFLWAAEQELCSGQPSEQMGSGGAGGGEAQMLGHGVLSLGDKSRAEQQLELDPEQGGAMALWPLPAEGQCPGTTRGLRYARDPGGGRCVERDPGQAARARNFSSRESRTETGNHLLLM